MSYESNRKSPGRKRLGEADKFDCEVLLTDLEEDGCLPSRFEVNGRGFRKESLVDIVLKVENILKEKFDKQSKAFCSSLAK